jgi:hypothetical protein
MHMATTTQVQTPMFEAGTVETTDIAELVLTLNHVTVDQLIARHRGGDFGQMADAGGAEANTRAIANGTGLVSSSFPVGQNQIIVQTNLNTSQTLVCENLIEFGRAAAFMGAALPAGGSVEISAPEAVSTKPARGGGGVAF